MCDVRTVLIIEDDDDLRRMFRTSLAFAGFRVLEAADGYSALHRLDDAMPDAIVLDLDLPLVNGHVIRAELAASAKMRHIPIIVVTGTRIDTMTPRVACLLHKPVSPEDLVLTVRRCLASPTGPAGS